MYCNVEIEYFTFYIAIAVKTQLSSYLDRRQHPDCHTSHTVKQHKGSPYSHDNDSGSVP